MRTHFLQLSHHLLVLVLLFISVTSKAETDNHNWQWQVAPYLWASDLDIDFQSDSPPVGGGPSFFDDILSKLDMVFEIQAEGHIKDNGLLVDFMYFDFSDDVRYDLIQTNTTTRLTAWMFDFAGYHRLQQSKSYFDVFAGIRWFKLRTTFDFERTTPPVLSNQLKATETFLDILAGIRYQYELNSNWATKARFDISQGETEGSWDARIEMDYKIRSKSKDRIFFGYRARHIEADLGSTSLQIEMQGPYVGYNFIFK